jgi:uncharacterized Ntn-hydrolase superfamily protein
MSPILISPASFSMMEAGHSARDAIERVTEDRANINYRQLIAVDLNGSVGS